MKEYGYVPGQTVYVLVEELVRLGSERDQALERVREAQESISRLYSEMRNLREKAARVMARELEGEENAVPRRETVRTLTAVLKAEGILS